MLSSPLFLCVSEIPRVRWGDGVWVKFHAVLRFPFSNVRLEEASAKWLNIHRRGRGCRGSRREARAGTKTSVTPPEKRLLPH